MKKYFLTIALLFFIPRLHAQQFYNVLNYGARNDSSKIATKAIAAAIDAASKKGGWSV